MHLPEKSIMFAHSDIGLVITVYLANNYSGYLFTKAKDE